MTPEEAGWRHLAFETVALAAGDHHTGRADGRETAITVLAGSGTVTAGEVKAYLDREMTYAARRRFGREQNASAAGDLKTVLARR